MLALPTSGSDAEPQYAVLGRALSFASSFEFDCRMLAVNLTLRDPSLDGAPIEQVAKVLQAAAVGPLGRNHERMVKDLRLSESAEDWLATARDARNFIAHQAGEEFESKLASPEEWQQWLSTLKTKVQALAVGKVAVTILLSRVSSVPRPTPEAIDLFIANASGWVLHRTGG